MLQNFLNVGFKYIEIDGPVGVSSVSNYIVNMSQGSEVVIRHVVVVFELRNNVESFIHDHIDS